MPYITEELWQRVAPIAKIDEETIMLCQYPKSDASLINKAVITDLEWVKQFIMGVRQIRSEMDIKPGKPLPVLCQNGSDQDQTRLMQNQNLLKSLAKLESISWLNEGEPAAESATSIVGDMSLLIPLAGLIDKDVELARLNKNIQKFEQEAKRIESKLGNDGFVSKAPESVVNKEKEKLSEAKSALASFQAQADKIKLLP
tara:strand:- start:263 stop:862 length:600 start_codon:yes stop_codon:yes gene_type:complete